MSSPELFPGADNIAYLYAGFDFAIWAACLILSALDIVFSVNLKTIVLFISVSPLLL